jgi:hypothetical protein
MSVPKIKSPIRMEQAVPKRIKEKMLRNNFLEFIFNLPEAL